MFTMNVPKFLRGESMKTAAYLINRMTLRVLDNKSPAELLLDSNEFVVSPKVFDVFALFMTTEMILET
jgi:hypothetical protein